MSVKKRPVIPLTRAMQHYYDLFQEDPKRIDDKIRHFLINQAVRAALNHGMVAEVKKLLSLAGDGPNARELRSMLENGGRPPFGIKNLSIRIGRHNQMLRKRCVSYDARKDFLGRKYGITEARLKEVLSEYAKDELSSDEIAPEYLQRYRNAIKRREAGETLSDDDLWVIDQVERIE
ncbi:hypothetical protein CQ062_11680 [Ochrobactrum sp. MYb68]|nr:hypothetical protein CQ062_11680 [Ochrobactrum sp. MYb68]